MEFVCIQKNCSKSFLLLIISIGLSFLSAIGFGQNLDYNPDKLLSIQQQESDFTLLYSSIENIHPAYKVFISENEYKLLVKETLENLNTEQTELEFQNEMRRFLKKIGCGHTSAKPSTQWYQMLRFDQRILPFKVFLVKEKAYIRYSTVADSLLKFGTEIISINDVPVSEILTNMKAIQEVDGYSKSYEQKRVEKLFQTYHLFLYGLHDEFNIEFLNDQNENEQLTIKSNPSNGSNLVKLNSPDDSDLKSSGSKFYLIDKLDHTALLDINSFPTGKFKAYYKQVFKMADDNDIQNLIIDLRGNGGGYFPNATNLLRYLMPEKYSLSFSRPKNKIKKNKHLQLSPIDKTTKALFNLIPDRNKQDPDRNFELRFKPKKKNHFDGKIYLLTDGATFSMSSYVTTKLKHYTDCTIIGQETGGGEKGSYALLWYKLRLPESEVQVSIPYYFLDHAVEPTLKGRGVMPDYPIEYDYDEIFLRIDKEMIMAEGLIRENN